MIFFFLAETENTILKFIWNLNGPQLAEITLGKKKRTELEEVQEV